MASAAQIAANQLNSQSSTGPRTAAGKQATSQNAAKFGLFSAKNCVFPQDRQEYDDMAAGLLEELTPVGNIETMLATEVIRCSWRLRRCAVAESELGEQSEAQTSSLNPERTPLDPSIVPELAKQQAAIDRARASAQNGLRRAMLSLAAHQNNRIVREQMPVIIDVSQANLACVPAVNMADNYARERRTEDAYRRTDQHLQSLVKKYRDTPATEATPNAPVANQTQSAQPAPESTAPGHKMAA